jgi:hypothetical protein
VPDKSEVGLTGTEVGLELPPELQETRTDKDKRRNSIDIFFIGYLSDLLINPYYIRKFFILS